MRAPSRLSILLVILIALVGLYVEQESRPKPRKAYNLLLMSGEEGQSKLSVDNMTHIKSTGFCTQIWRDDILDTVVCTPHIITEVTPEVETPKEKETKAHGGS